jgi:DnaJ-class molecular chaperone
MNYYQILEIDKYSNTKIIKKHYYQLSKKYHPDKNKGISDENFKKLSEAYSTLSNPKKRYLYDMKLLIKDNLGEDFVLNFSDTELELLNEYYLKLTKTTEFKFIKLIFNSLPINIKTKMKKKFNQNIKSHSLISLRDIKYIYSNSLKEDYTINLNRSLKDVYLNKCKEIIICASTKSYHLFITHSDYSYKVYNNKNSFVYININTILTDNYSLNGNDLYYNYQINLYEYYFKDNFMITLPNDLCIDLKNACEFNKSTKIDNYGLKNNNNYRGDLYIYKNLNLNIKDKNKYKNVLKEIFT